MSTLGRYCPDLLIWEKDGVISVNKDRDLAWLDDDDVYAVARSPYLSVEGKIALIQFLAMHTHRVEPRVYAAYVRAVFGGVSKEALRFRLVEANPSEAEHAEMQSVAASALIRGSGMRSSTTVRVVDEQEQTVETHVGILFTGGEVSGVSELTDDASTREFVLGIRYNDIPMWLALRDPMPVLMCPHLSVEQKRAACVTLTLVAERVQNDNITFFSSAFNNAFPRARQLEDYVTDETCMDIVVESMSSDGDAVVFEAVTLETLKGMMACDPGRAPRANKKGNKLKAEDGEEMSAAIWEILSSDQQW
jgi:hypothetical protein